MSIVERALAKGRSAAQERAGGRPDEPPSYGHVHDKPDAGALANLDRAKGAINLPKTELRLAGLAPPVDAEHILAEELRVIKRPLFLNAAAGEESVPHGKLVMVGSALPGAGKTFTSFSLASSMASELDWSVLLVDADVSRPTLSRSLGLADAPGLLGFLEDNGGRLVDFVFKTDQPGLHFLPAGKSPRAKELIGSQRMANFVEDLATSTERRIVLFDSPPLLLTSEARVLAFYVGQIALVVEAGVTSRRALADAIEMLDPTKAINLILNKTRYLPGVQNHYYAGYYYDGRDRDESAGG